MIELLLNVPSGDSYDPQKDQSECTQMLLPVIDALDIFWCQRLLLEREARPRVDGATTCSADEPSRTLMIACPTFLFHR